METISNTDFDRLEKLLKTKRFDELDTAEKEWVKAVLSEEEYIAMVPLYTSLNNDLNYDAIEPTSNTKTALDKAFATKAKGRGIFQMKMPVYQSVAAALILFFVGFGMNNRRNVETRIVHNTVQVIKYITKPENVVKMAANVPKHAAKRARQLITVPTQHVVPDEISDKVETVSESNPEFARQQEIAMTNIYRVLNEKNGSSIGGDTVLQRMMVTVY